MWLKENTFNYFLGLFAPIELLGLLVLKSLHLFLNIYISWSCILIIHADESISCVYS